MCLIDRVIADWVFDRYVGGYDGNQGLGQQMTALETIQVSLYELFDASFGQVSALEFMHAPKTLNNEPIPYYIR